MDQVTQIFGMAFKFNSYLMYVGCVELWKEPDTPVFEFRTVVVSGGMEP